MTGNKERVGIAPDSMTAGKREGKSLDIIIFAEKIGKSGKMNN